MPVQRPSLMTVDIEPSIRQMSKKTNANYGMTETWTLPSAATLGSSVRAKGILLELRARLPLVSRNNMKSELGSASCHKVPGRQNGPAEWVAEV